MASAENDSAVARVVGFQRENHKEHIIRFDHQALVKWQSSVTETFTSTPIAGLGAMDRLPNELITSIFNELDIETVVNFCYVNRIARQLVIATLEFRRIATHAPTCLLAVLQTGVSRYFTFPDLYHAMLLRHCDVCQGLASYVYLPTLTKACDNCLTMKNRFITVTLASFARQAKHTTARLRRQVPVVKSLPGNYRDCGTVRTRRFDMMSYTEAMKFVKENTTSVAAVAPAKCFGYERDGQFTRRMVTAPLPFFNEQTQAVEPILSCKGCAIDHDLKFKTQIMTDLMFQSRLWRYTPDLSTSQLAEHCKHCSMARTIWAASKNGTVSINHFDTPFIQMGAVRKQLIRDDRYKL